MRNTYGRVGGLLAFSATFVGSVWAQTATQPVTDGATRVGSVNSVEAALVARDWSRQVWSAATAGDLDKVVGLLEQSPKAGVVPGLHDAATALRADLDKRDESRAKRLEEIRAELDKALGDDASDLALSKALVLAIDLGLVKNDPAAARQDPRVVALIEKADVAARAAEARADWLISSELFYRLDMLLEEDGRYTVDNDRQNQRLGMLRLYVPERLWQLRDVRAKADNLPAIPPYNPYGDDFRTKLASIDRLSVARALIRAGTEHVQRVPLEKLLERGLDALTMLVSTPDLAEAFPVIKDGGAKADFLAAIERERAWVRAQAAKLDVDAPGDLITRLMQANDKTLRIFEPALLHEFGNGAMGALDPFSGFIWPDELARFNRTTQGKLIGIGVEIQYDELYNVKVVTPLEGLPAQRAGVRANDLITKVNGQSVYGITLDQAVDLITGPVGTDVTIAFQRRPDPAKPADDAENRPSEHEFTITRAEIPLRSVKGWRRLGAQDDGWQWMIDPSNGIGYIRLTGFTETSTREFDRALEEMKAQGLNGLVFDLRFNTGGLLDQAISIASRFIPRGVIVSTRDSSGRVRRQETAVDVPKSVPRLNKIPVVVLVNQDSASASEIVAGAIQDFAREGKLRAVLLGRRTYGKGSVQDVNVISGGRAALKLTSQYYILPQGRLIHRTPGATVWGVEPDLSVEMLPTQVVEAVLLRRDADVVPLDENGKAIETTPRPNPDDLIAKGIDLQLETALAILRSQIEAPEVQQAQKPE